LPLLREEIAGLYEEISADDVLVLAPEEGIFLALNAILEAGDHLICTYPGYQSLYEVAQGLGCTITRWLPNEGVGWKFDPEFLLSAIQPNTKLLVINFPHNPTGYLPPAADFQRMIEIARAHNLIILSDEMYRLLELNEADRLPTAADAYENAISLFGMSKTFGLAGLRIGWLVTQNRDLLARIASLKDYTTICSSAPSEVLALIGLQARQTIVTEHRQLIAVNLRHLDDFFARRSDLLTWVKPKAGTIGFARLRADLSAEQFCKQVVEEAGIMLLPSTVYDFNDQHVRIGFGRRNLPEVLAAFDAYLNANLM
jgi:aspartate/methionine/tyrosine aminotransferase